MATALSISTKFTAVDQFTNTVNRMSAATNKFATSASTNFAAVEREGRKLGKGVMNITNGLFKLGAAAGGLSLAGGAIAGADAFLDLDKNISAASAKFGIFSRNDKRFKAIRDKAVEMGATTEFTSGKAAEALENMATAGFDAEQAIAGINTILNLATASQTEIGIAADVAAKSLAAFGLKSKDPKILADNLSMTSDVLNKLITTSGFGQMEEFLDVISQSGSSARAAGVDVQTWGAIVASSVSEAVPASVAGTRFANMLGFMTKNTKAFNKLGIQLKDKDTGNFRDIIAIMGDIEAKTKSMDKFDRAGLMLELFGERGSKMAVSILENGVPALEKYREEIRGAGGTTAKMATFMRSGLTGGINAMTSAFESIAIAIGDAFAPEIESTIKNLTTIASNTKSWVQENKPLLKGIFEIGIFLLKLAVAIKAVSLAVTLYRNMVMIAQVAQWAWNVAMTANPIGLIIAAIVALIALVAVMVNKWDEWGAALVFIAGPLGIIVSIIQAFRKNWDLIKQAFAEKGIIEGLKMIGATLLEAIIYPIQKLLELLTKIPVIGEKIQAFLKNWDLIKQAFSEKGIIEGLKMIGATLLEAIISPIQKLLELLTKISVIVSIIQAFRKNWDLIKQAFAEKGIIEGLKMIGATLLEAIISPIQKLLELLTKIPVIGEKIQPAVAKLQSFREGLGLNTTTSASGELLNPEASALKTNKTITEKTVNQKLAIDINDKSGLASVTNNTGIPVNLSQTLGWQ